MKVKRLVSFLIAFGILTSQFRVYAHEYNNEVSGNLNLPDSVKTVDSPLYEGASRLPENLEYRFNAKQLILPGSLIVTGTVGVYNGAFKKLNSKVKSEMTHLRGNCYFHADDYIQYIPAITYLAFGSIGIKSKHSFKERLVVEATSYLTMAALTHIGKYSFKEKRPDSNARNSFPSGHTATVFTGAELMREEYGLGLGIAAYSVATGVAFLRLYNGRHWFNDVIAGAGLGILSARIGYWMLPLYQRWFKWNNSSSERLLVSPTCNPSERLFLINFAYEF